MVVQYNTDSKCISNTGKFAKMVHPDFFGEDGGRSYHHSDLENQWLPVGSRLW